MGTLLNKVPPLATALKADICAGTFTLRNCSTTFVLCRRIYIINWQEGQFLIRTLI